MAADYDLAPDWLNSSAAAFIPDNATWATLEQLGGLTIQAADTETPLEMKIAAERDKDTPDIARLLRRLNITNANDAHLAYNKYGDDSIPLAAGWDNYLIVVDDALDAATTPRTQRIISQTRPPERASTRPRVWITITEIETSSRPSPFRGRKP